MGFLELEPSALCSALCSMTPCLGLRTMPPGVQRLRTNRRLHSTQSQKYFLGRARLWNPLLSLSNGRSRGSSSSISHSEPPGSSNVSQQQSGFAQIMFVSLSFDGSRNMPIGVHSGTRVHYFGRYCFLKAFDRTGGIGSDCDDRALRLDNHAVDNAAREKLRRH